MRDFPVSLVCLYFGRKFSQDPTSDKSYVGFKFRTGLNFFRSYLQLLVSVVFLAARIS